MPNNSIPEVTPTLGHKMTVFIFFPQCFRIRHLRCLPLSLAKTGDSPHPIPIAFTLWNVYHL